MECNASDERAKILASEVIGLEEKVGILLVCNFLEELLYTIVLNNDLEQEFFFHYKLGNVFNLYFYEFDFFWIYLPVAIVLDWIMYRCHFIFDSTISAVDNSHYWRKYSMNWLLTNQGCSWTALFHSIHFLSLCKLVTSQIIAF